MPAGHGSRARTRDSFSRAFRKHGYVPISTYLRNYKLGDYVDIRVNSAVMKVPTAQHVSYCSSAFGHHPEPCLFCRVCHTRCTTAALASCGT